MLLLDAAGMSDPKVPTLDLPGSLVVGAPTKKLVIMDIKDNSISDHVRLIGNAKDKMMTIKLDTNDDAEKVEYLIGIDEMERGFGLSKFGEFKSGTGDKKGNLTSLYPLGDSNCNGFETMIKAVLTGFGPKVPIQMKFGEDYPIEMRVETPGRSMMMLLAPRIESE